MLPRIGPLPSHELFVGLGVAVAVVVFVVEARRRGQTDERLIYVVAGALVGGALLMRLGTWAQHVDLRDNASLAEQWLYGNRSILGGLVGAWLGVHIAKRIAGYPLRTGDLFAPAVALGMAVGRVGCLLTELPGTRYPPALGDRRAAPVLRLRDRLPSRGVPRSCGCGCDGPTSLPARPSSGTSAATASSGSSSSSSAETRWCGWDDPAAAVLDLHGPAGPRADRVAVAATARTTGLRAAEDEKVAA